MGTASRRALTAAGIVLTLGAIGTLGYLGYPSISVFTCHLYSMLVAGILMCVASDGLVRPGHEKRVRELDSKVQRMASDLKELWALNAFKSAQTESSVRMIETKDEE